MTIEKKNGKINVLIQRQTFTEAIKMIAESNLLLAKALTCPPQINIHDCTISGTDIGITVGSFDDSQKFEKVEELAPSQSEKVKEKLKRGRPAKMTAPDGPGDTIVTDPDDYTGADPLSSPAPPEGPAIDINIEAEHSTATYAEVPSTATTEGQGPDLGETLNKLAEKGWPLQKIQVKFGKKAEDWGEKELSMLADMANE